MSRLTPHFLQHQTQAEKRTSAWPQHYVIISPETWARSGDVAAVEYGNETPMRIITRVAYTDDFIVLESINQKTAPIALIRGKDHFRIIGRVIQRIQHM